MTRPSHFVVSATAIRAAMPSRDFSKEAHEFVKHIDSKIILIARETLTQLINDHHLGVASVATCDVKRLEADYFVDGERADCRGSPPQFIRAEPLLLGEGQSYGRCRIR